jgi:hypothetical protein
MTTTLAILVSIAGGIAALVAGLRRNLSGVPLILTVAVAVIGVFVLMSVAVIALKAVLIAAVIVGVYYAVKGVRRLLGYPKETRQLE